VLSVVWNFLIAAQYNRALATVADGLSSAKIVTAESFDKSTREQYGIRENTIWVTTVSQPGVLKLQNSLEGSAVTYGMPLVLSLIAATPGLTWRRRLKFILIALLLMFALHVIAILIFARTVLSGANIPQSPSINLFLVVGVGLFPALIWVALSLRYWFPSQQKEGRAVRRRDAKRIRGD
jgi:hypothetical protein